MLTWQFSCKMKNFTDQVFLPLRVYQQFQLHHEDQVHHEVLQDPVVQVVPVILVFLRCQVVLLGLLSLEFQVFQLHL